MCLQNNIILLYIKNVILLIIIINKSWLLTDFNLYLRKYFVYTNSLIIPEDKSKNSGLNEISNQISGSK